MRADARTRNCSYLSNAAEAADRQDVKRNGLTSRCNSLEYKKAIHTALSFAVGRATNAMPEATSAKAAPSCQLMGSFNSK
jgi:hypothetical protein